MTGGTGDVSPQWLTALATPQTGASAETSIQLPVTRIPQSGVATIIEVLRIYVDWLDTNLGATAADVTQMAVCTIGTKSFGTTQNLGLGEPTVFATVREVFNKAFTAAGTFSTVVNPVQVFDCEDGAGHGVLVATDKMYVQITLGAAVNPPSGGAQVPVKLLYRFKNVSIEEYVGIVQSQQ